MKNVKELANMGASIIAESNDLTIDEAKQFEDILKEAVRNEPSFEVALFDLVCKAYYAGYYLGNTSKE